MSSRLAPGGPAPLHRRLGVVDATLIGVGSMIGAGVFVAWSPAARAAGGGLLLALVLAGAVAYCNATASAQLAAVYPVSGGTYVYATERLTPLWGFVAGWAFVVGKTASCAVMAQAVARYAVGDPGWRRALVSVLVVAVVTGLNYLGVARTAMATRFLLACTGVVLLGFVIAVWSAPGLDRGSQAYVELGRTDLRGVIRGAGIMFFAFAGYARIATMGEEVRDPARAIPRAIQAALAMALLVYLAVGATLLRVLSPADLARAASPLRAALDAAQRPQLHWLVITGATLAGTGALLGLMAGIGRTALAMAREGDLPRALSAIHPRFAVPHRAEILLGAVVALLAGTVDLASALGFSSFGVLVYYALANASAATQTGSQRRWPRWLNVAGFGGCVVLAVSLPWRSVGLGMGVLVLGVAGRRLLRRSTPG